MWFKVIMSKRDVCSTKMTEQTPAMWKQSKTIHSQIDPKAMFSPVISWPSQRPWPSFVRTSHILTIHHPWDWGKGNTAASNTDEYLRKKPCTYSFLSEERTDKAASQPPTRMNTSEKKTTANTLSFRKNEWIRQHRSLQHGWIPHAQKTHTHYKYSFLCEQWMDEIRLTSIRPWTRTGGRNEESQFIHSSPKRREYLEVFFWGRSHHVGVCITMLAVLPILTDALFTGDVRLEIKTKHRLRSLVSKIGITLRPEREHAWKRVPIWTNCDPNLTRWSYFQYEIMKLKKRSCPQNLSGFREGNKGTEGVQRDR